MRTEQEAAIQRVQEMEQLFDDLLEVWATSPAAFRTDDAIRQKWSRLTAYYDSPQWQTDYHLDEQGVFPQGMKRGILSEDGFYNFLCDVEAFLRAEE